MKIYIKTDMTEMSKGLYSLKDENDIFEWLDGDSEKEKRYEDEYI